MRASDRATLSRRDVSLRCKIEYVTLLKSLSFISPVVVTPVVASATNDDEDCSLLSLARSGQNCAQKFSEDEYFSWSVKYI